MNKEEYEKMKERCKPRFYDMDTKHLNDVLEWGRYIDKLHETGEFNLKSDFVGKYEISTIYVGLDMGMFNPEPLIFETMIFCEDKEDPLYMWMERYTYKDQALEGHQRAIILASGISNDR